MICIHIQYENMNPVRAGMGVCVFLGVCAFEYVSVNESQHVRVKCKCDCQNVYMHLCTICYHE